MPAWLERTLSAAQGLLPQRFLTHLVYRAMRSEVRWLKNLQIRTISRLAGVNWSEAASNDLDDYQHFNAFFTRELKAGARPQPEGAGILTSPCDGHISELGEIDGERLFQAKGQYYSLQQLLADDPACEQFIGGSFITIYLSPRDYHRVHMPLSGQLQRMIHVPGKLFSVAPYTVRHVPALFARNERVVSIFETGLGPVAQILVGAMLVASMETVWAGEVTPSKVRDVTVTDYSDTDIRLQRGDEMGRFNMGSTVILVLPPGTTRWNADLQAGQPVMLGQTLGGLTQS
jgi:phosphatidylserine decarboxylase